MFETLFGVEVPLAVKFVFAFVIVLLGIAVFAWALRRFGSDRFGGASARGRQPRLALVDRADIDQRRSLVIIRRDNVEHLLMIGGPTDVVVEQNIVRAMGAPRDKNMEPTLGRGLSVSETLTRPVPLGEGTMWPLQPQPETNGRTPRAAPEEPAQWTWPAHPEPQQRASRAEPRMEKPDTPANLGDEFSARSTPPREPAPARPVTPPPLNRPTPPAAPQAERIEKIEKITPVAESDQNLAAMANRLEPSLRRPSEPRASAEPPLSEKTEPMRPPLAPRVTPESRITPPEPRVPAPEPRLAPPEQKPARAETKPKAVFDSLEEEMASLLGRPPGKT